MRVEIWPRIRGLGIGRHGIQCSFLFFFGGGARRFPFGFLAFAFLALETVIGFAGQYTLPLDAMRKGGPEAALSLFLVFRDQVLGSHLAVSSRYQFE